MRKHKLGHRALGAEPLETRVLLAGDVADLGAMLADRVTSFYERADENVDGELTADEVSERAWTRLVEADADDSGGVSSAELMSHLEAKISERQESGGETDRGGRYGGGHGGGRFGGGRHAGGRHGGCFGGEIDPEALAERIAARVDQVFASADANEDGGLTMDEVSENRWEKIGEADADSDGAVTKDELISAIEARIAERYDDGDGETDDGETDGGETDDGETDGGETDGGEADGGETDGGETEPAAAVAEVAESTPLVSRSVMSPLARRARIGFRTASAAL